MGDRYDQRPRLDISVVVDELQGTSDENNVHSSQVKSSQERCSAETVRTISPTHWVNRFWGQTFIESQCFKHNNSFLMMSVHNIACNFILFGVSDQRGWGLSSGV